MSRKIFVPGKILAVSVGTQNNIPGVLLTVDKENKCKVLVVAEKKDASSPNTSECGAVPWSRKLFYPHLKKPEVVVVSFKDIDVISNKSIRIQENDILKEWRRMETVYVYIPFCFMLAGEPVLCTGLQIYQIQPTFSAMNLYFLHYKKESCLFLIVYSPGFFYLAKCKSLSLVKKIGAWAVTSYLFFSI